MVYYQHYDEIINQLLNTCKILVRGRSDLFNSGGRWSKGGGEGIFSKFRGELAKKGELKIQGGGGLNSGSSYDSDGMSDTMNRQKFFLPSEHFKKCEVYSAGKDVLFFLSNFVWYFMSYNISNF